MRTFPRLALVLTLLFLISVRCSKDSNPVGPAEPPTVTITGTAGFPYTTGVDFSHVKIRLADQESALDSARGFTLSGSGGVPALIVAAEDDSIPLLMAVEPGLEDGSSVMLGSYSTAVALVYLSPLICGGTPEEALAVLQVITNLPEMDNLLQILRPKLVANPKILATGDEEIAAAVDQVILAFLADLSYPTLPGKIAPARKTEKIMKVAEGVPQISPTTPVSGLQLTFDNGSTFKLSNSYCRWLYCVTPEEEFFAFPCGTLLDILLLKAPWGPSERKLNLAVPASGNPVDVRVYGLGWANVPDNSWDALTDIEKNYALRGGFSTVAFELVPHIVATVTNTAHATGRPAIAKDAYMKVLTTLFNDPRIMDRCIQYIRNADYWGMTWFLAKWIIGRITVDQSFRDAYLPAIGLSISAPRLAGFAKGANLAMKTLVVGESVTGAANTYLGITKGRFKTTFTVKNEATAFGNISGSVHDKNTGKSISGVVVDLTGDENNPMNPPHQKITDAQGGFYFENIKVGTVTLTASKTGFTSASVDVAVQGGQTVSKSIEIASAAGTLTGKILNDIYIQNNITPATMKADVYVEITEASSGTHVTGATISGGTYSFDLPVGTYRVIASHDDYLMASAVATVTINLVTQAPDIVLKPIGFMTGTISVDTDLDGKYEVEVTYAENKVACAPYTEPGSCPSGTRGPLFWIGKYPPDFLSDNVSIIIDPAAILGAGEKTLSEVEVVGCSGSNAGAYVLAWTKDLMVSMPGATGPVAFTYHSGGTDNNCACGVVSPGSIFLTEFGDELADPIAGAIGATLAGWSKGECYPNMDPGCYRAYVNLSFRVLRGAK